MLDTKYSNNKLIESTGYMSTHNSKRKIDDEYAENKRTKIECVYCNKKQLPLTIVIAVGGNALLRRGEKLSYENQLKAAMNAAHVIKKFSQFHQIILTHGNGPQVGALALERKSAPFDLLGAETQGQIGYIFSQALETVGQTAVPIITQVRVDNNDISFKNPTKFIGPIYTKDEAEKLIEENKWDMKEDGKYWRRVVPSPPPLQIMQLDAAKILLKSNLCQPPMKLLPVLCGGGGSPIKYDESGAVKGVEAVIDKDNCGALLANELDADIFIILTDGGGIYENFGTPQQREMKEVTPEYLLSTKAGVDFPGSMGPKINAVINFVQRSNKENSYAIIGDLKDAENVLTEVAGTKIKKNVDGNVIWRDKNITI